jgi:CubicO group peptidase (beta-lactamase class C family)
MNLILGITATLLLLLPISRENVASPELADRIAFIKDHFGEMHFKPEGGFILRKGRPLPDLVWYEPEVASALLKDTSIPTRWFDSELNEVTKAEKVGRYYVYGEAPAPEGAPLYRAMTCLCLDESENLELLALRLNPGQEPRVQEIVKAWREDEERTITLCGKLESGPPYEPERPGQWHMENATVHVRLKRKIRNVERLVEVKARKLEGTPAPVLSAGEIELTYADRKFKTKMEDLYERWHRSSGQPMSVVVARNGQVLVSRGYGEMDGKPVTVNTPMLLHSAMKPIMGLQLAMYVDREFIALDEPIGNYLPEFDTPRDKTLTFRVAQVHTTGINFPWSLAFSRHFYFHTWHEALIAKCPRDWNPGDRYQYGCVGMSLSVRAIEVLTGKNYWEAMEEQLFEPIGIKDMHPGGTGFSAEDLARLGVLVANRGKYGSLELFSEKACDAIMPVQLQEYIPNLDEERMRGIGFTTMAPGFYGHGGGCGTRLLVDPENHLVYAMTRMESDDKFGEFNREATDLLQELKHRVP